MQQIMLQQYFKVKILLTTNLLMKKSMMQ